MRGAPHVGTMAAFRADVERILHEESMTREVLAKRMGVSAGRVSQMLSPACSNLTLRSMVSVYDALGRALALSSALKSGARDSGQERSVSPEEIQRIEVVATDLLVQRCHETAEIALRGAGLGPLTGGYAGVLLRAAAERLESFSEGVGYRVEPSPAMAACGPPVGSEEL